VEIVHVLKYRDIYHVQKKDRDISSDGFRNERNDREMLMEISEQY